MNDTLWATLFVGMMGGAFLGGLVNPLVSLIGAVAGGALGLWAETRRQRKSEPCPRCHGVGRVSR